MSDPLRAKLDWFARCDEGCPDELAAALRAVLDECAASAPLGDLNPEVRWLVNDIRVAIAEHLGLDREQNG